MKKLSVIFCALLLMATGAKAQTYVTIPDANFAAWLQSYAPACMNGNQMNTDCVAIQNATYVNVSNQNISNLSGIEYFVSLQTLYCNYNQLSVLPDLPASLLHLYCDHNPLTAVPTLPASLQSLYCNHNQLSSLPALPASLQVLFCHHNQLTALPALPALLQDLYCQNNQLTVLPALPAQLSDLDFDNNQVSVLPALPASLQELRCHSNQLSILPALPATLLKLFCSFNQLTALPPLPESLQHFDCNSNTITCFPEFPASLSFPNYFNISGNPFTCVPNYVSAMNSQTSAYPLCVAGDAVNNPNGCMDITTGISAHADDFGPGIYPNPNSGQFTLQVPAQKSSVTIYNIFGAVVSTFESTSNLTRVSLENHPKGIYVVAMVSAGGLSCAKVLVE